MFNRIKTIIKNKNEERHIIKLRSRIKNTAPTIISNNCIAGIIYSWFKVFFTIRHFSRLKRLGIRENRGLILIICFLFMSFMKEREHVKC